MFNYRNKIALVTGASTGIGYCFAEELAARGADLILVARSADKLQALALRLSGTYKVKAYVLTADLIAPGAAARILTEVAERGLRVDILVNNAGFGTYGLFHSLDLAKEAQEIQLNVTALVELTHGAMQGMIARGEGAVINIASTAAFQPLPYMAVYGATKAFVLSFTESLYGQYQSDKLRFLAVCPGATETPFFDAMGSSEPGVGAKDTPQNCAREGLKALEAGRNYLIPGPISTYLLAQVSRFIPRKMAISIAGDMMRPKSLKRT
jgi:short-subunit dehydrogenase